MKLQEIRESKEEQKAPPIPPPLNASRVVFTTVAWAKYKWLCKNAKGEVGAMLISSEHDPLLIEDLVVLSQWANSGHFEFDEDAIMKYVMECAEKNMPSWRFFRGWAHTHPGNSAKPSGQDEETFTETFAGSNWSLMVILAKQGDHYARIRIRTGQTDTEGMREIFIEKEIPIEILPEFWDTMDHPRTLHFPVDEWQESLKLVREKTHTHPTLGSSHHHGIGFHNGHSHQYDIDDGPAGRLGRKGGRGKARKKGTGVADDKAARTGVVGIGYKCPWDLQEHYRLDNAGKWQRRVYGGSSKELGVVIEGFYLPYHTDDDKILWTEVQAIVMGELGMIHRIVVMNGVVRRENRHEKANITRKAFRDWVRPHCYRDGSDDSMWDEILYPHLEDFMEDIFPDDSGVMDFEALKEVFGDEMLLYFEQEDIDAMASGGGKNDMDRADFYSLIEEAITHKLVEEHDKGEDDAAGD